MDLRAAILDSEDPIAGRAVTEFVEGLRAEIISGQRFPNSRVQFDELKKSFNLSLSPIREGVSHLVAEGFLVVNGQRGYRVAPLSLEEFLDLQKMRIWAEIKALRESISQGGEQWEIDLMTAFKRLQKFEARRWSSEEIQGWEQRHHAYHETLIGACNSPLLIRICHMLHQMSDRYRRVCLKNQDPDRNVAVEHEVMYEAALSRNADKASEVLQVHIERTGRNVLAVMRDQAGSKQ